MNHRLVIAGSVTLVLATGTGAWVFAQQSRGEAPEVTPTTPTIAAAPAVRVVPEVRDPKACQTACEFSCKAGPVFADLPDAVRAAVLTKTAERSITRVEKVQDGDGPVMYVIRYTEEREAFLNAEGSFVDGC